MGHVDVSVSDAGLVDAQVHVDSASGEELVVNELANGSSLRVDPSDDLVAHEASGQDVIFTHPVAIDKPEWLLLQDGADRILLDAEGVQVVDIEGMVNPGQTCKDEGLRVTQSVCMTFHSHSAQHRGAQ